LTRRVLDHLREALSDAARTAFGSGRLEEAQHFYELALHPDVDFDRIGALQTLPDEAEAGPPERSAPESSAPIAVESSPAMTHSVSSAKLSSRIRQEGGDGEKVQSTATSRDLVGAGSGASMPPVRDPPPSRPATASAEVSAALLERGNEYLSVGDIAAARLVFERAATAGSVAAMTGLGKAYDPFFFETVRVRGIRPDSAIAADWYRRAAALGDMDSARRLARIQSADGR
jgi:hypothetical protein